MAQDNITDTVDVIHYDLCLDMGNNSEKRMEGSAAITLVTLRQIDSIALELCPSDVDSVWMNGHASPFRFDAPNRLLLVPFTGNVGDTEVVTVFYRKGQYVMPQGWGGFYFDNDLYYNLGIAIYEYPHNAGKAWFPCRDNFYDHATYHFEITAKPGWKAVCTGMCDTVMHHADGSSTWHWTLNHPTPTYLVGVAVAPFHIIEREFEGEEATYPAIIGFLGHDSTNVWRTFDRMSKVIPMYERCFGPYRWDRVGYVSTTRGSMEHVGNVAFTTDCMASQQEACFATMAHEFAHSWFGNLITCATSEDMWINEGGASFCEEVAVQARYAETSPTHYKDFARGNLRRVLLTAHLNDNGFKPVYGLEHEYTYGSTVYNKGATVWHSLRGYMGEELFYSSMQKLFSRHAFKNIDSWQLRDSLSLYSGIDLTDFFRFHVFNAGFVDYDIDSLAISRSSTAVYIRQKSYGTDTLAHGNRVWVSFFSQDMQIVKRLITFDGESARVVVQLPFMPAFAIVDYDEELSKASTGQFALLNSQGQTNMGDVFFKADVQNDNTWAWLHVKHHWTSPDSSSSPQITRMASRYWTVTGLLPENDDIQGRFYFCRSGSEGSLDNAFVVSSTQIPLLRLLYREGAGKPWRVVSSQYEGNNGNGYFVTPTLLKGEYTLALTDTSYQGIAAPQEVTKETLRVFPNPTSGKVTIESTRLNEPLSVDIFDNGGRLLHSNLRLRSGECLDLTLPTGNYLLLVRHTETGKMSSKKIQIMNF